MADEKQTASKSSAPVEEKTEEASNTRKKSKARAGTVDTVSSSKSAASDINAGSLPIEGESKWVNVMRILAASVLGVFLVMAGAFHFLTAEDSFLESNQLVMIMGGIIFLLVLEYFVFLLIVIPRQADYGRYVIHRDRVDYYPLTALGLSISEKPGSVRIARFSAVMTGVATDKKGRHEYAVYLVHSENKGKTINVRSFSRLKEAENFAARLGQMLDLKAVSGTHKLAKE